MSSKAAGRRLVGVHHAIARAPGAIGCRARSHAVQRTAQQVRAHRLAEGLDARAVHLLQTPGHRQWH
ncbi:hypothetical protein [Streptomyces sp. WAC05858]|uniref:hypothetical protein n=1 Tax=Streptomyces sp. WAC05858 TaxID=2487409 RepID=UPI001C8E5234